MRWHYVEVYVVKVADVSKEMLDYICLTINIEKKVELKSLLIKMIR